MPESPLLIVLARAFLEGDRTREQIRAHAKRALGKAWPWLPSLVDRYLFAFADRARPRLREVLAFLRGDTGLSNALIKYAGQITVEHWLAPPQAMRPVEAAREWELPAITTSGDLASWLGVSVDELEWFADLKGLLTRRKVRHELQHYHYRVLAKPFGDSVRLIEAPKPRLKEMQRRILTQILERIPIHPAVHGFVKGRSIRTFVTPHTNQRCVLKMDLRDFFTSISGPRVQALFRTGGYPESVADLLGGLCSNITPKSIRAMLPDGQLFARPHLPQGAPTSPALANLCAYRADCRLAGLAQAAGVTYTRYADDLAFSGDVAFERFSIHAAAILAEEGFSVNHRKTRIMRQGVRQRLAGLVANQHPNVIRADFDRLKATLFNCVRHGPGELERAHLEGRVGFVEMINPAKAAKLRALLERIDWSR